MQTNFLNYIDSGIETFSNLISRLYSFNTNNPSRLHPVSKLLFMILGVLTISCVVDIQHQFFITCFVYLLILTSKIRFSDFLRIISLPVFLFGILPSFFSIFNFISPGQMVFELFRFKSETNLFFIKLPQVISITREGVELFCLIFLRVLNSISISFYVLYTTQLSDFFMSMKFFKIPDFLLMIFMLTLKYIDLFSRMALDMYMARKSRVFKSSTKMERKWLLGVLFYLLRKSIMKQQDVFESMISRGFNGNVRLKKLPEFNKIDYVFMFAFISVFMLILNL